MKQLYVVRLDPKLVEHLQTYAWFDEDALVERVLKDRIKKLDKRRDQSATQQRLPIPA